MLPLVLRDSCRAHRRKSRVKVETSARYKTPTAVTPETIVEATRDRALRQTFRREKEALPSLPTHRRAATPHRNTTRKPTRAPARARPSTSDSRCSPPCGSAPHRRSAPALAREAQLEIPRAPLPRPALDQLASGR